ncbi:MAG: restriction endonuclease subunit S [Eubacteriales bacterium]|nr:restriction endonuclease subunit S [Eubacteriales bacterium]
MNSDIEGRVPLESICSRVCTGGTPKSSVGLYYKDGTIPWLNTQEINFNRIRSTKSKITEEGYRDSSAKWIPENCVIVAMYGATAGKVAVNKIPLTTNQACCNLQINPESADFRFVYYYLCFEYARLASLANGGAQQNLNTGIIGGFQIPNPSLSIQHAVADILSTLDDKIELNNRIIANLEAQAQAIFKSWFVDFEPLQDGEFEESELGLIPKGWSIFTFSEILTPSSEKDNSPDIPEYSVTNTGIYARDDKYKKKLSMMNSANKIIRKGDLVFGMSRTILNWGIMFDEIGGVSLAYHVFKVDERIPTKYLEGYMRSYISYFGDIIKPAAREGQGIDKSALYAKQIYLPNEHVVADYYSIEDEITASIENYRKQVATLEQVRDTLLPKLMSGEVEVPVEG